MLVLDNFEHVTAAAPGLASLLDRCPGVQALVTSQHTLVLRWSGHDQQHAGLIASGVAYYLVYARVNGGRAHRLARTTHRSFKYRTRPGKRYVFWTVAVDKAGNHETKPVRVQTRVRP